LVTLIPKTFALKQEISPRDAFAIIGIVDTPFQDDGPIAAAHIVGDLRSVLAIVHQQQVNLPNVIDKELLQPAGEKVSCLRLGVRFISGWILF